MKAALRPSSAASLSSAAAAATESTLSSAPVSHARPSSETQSPRSKPRSAPRFKFNLLLPIPDCERAQAGGGSDSSGNGSSSSSSSSVPFRARHRFDDPKEVAQIRARLLDWYTIHHRQLPWRASPNGTAAGRVPGEDHGSDAPVDRGYAQWVSEVMLQQTQVATVVNYFNRWMAKWPTVQDLARATPEEVQECWKGLGYYSRARRLHEGAVKIVEQLGGKMPETAEELQTLIPGVGPYTAAAISSIAYNRRYGVVDGNVIRVVTRLRAIGADVSGSVKPGAPATAGKSPKDTTVSVEDIVWSLSNTLVDPDRPGDFNQAIMELGATVCTPSNPSCDSCPLRLHCRAYAETRAQGPSADKPPISSPSECGLCLPASELENGAGSVTLYPRKLRKTKQSVQHVVSWIVVDKRGADASPPRYLIVKRDSTGLLANLWDFPSRILSSSAEKQAAGTDSSDDEESDGVLNVAGSRNGPTKQSLRTAATSTPPSAFAALMQGAAKPREPSESAQQQQESSRIELLTRSLAELVGKPVEGVLDLSSIRRHGTSQHLFSHVRASYDVESVELAAGVHADHVTDAAVRPCKWVTEQDMETCAIPTASVKIFRQYSLAPLGSDRASKSTKSSRSSSRPSRKAGGKPDVVEIVDDSDEETQRETGKPTSSLSVKRRSSQPGGGIASYFVKKPRTAQEAEDDNDV